MRIFDTIKDLLPGSKEPNIPVEALEGLAQQVKPVDRDVPTDDRLTFSGPVQVRAITAAVGDVRDRQDEQVVARVDQELEDMRQEVMAALDGLNLGDVDGKHVEDGTSVNSQQIASEQSNDKETYLS